MNWAGEAEEQTMPGESASNSWVRVRRVEKGVSFSSKGSTAIPRSLWSGLEAEMGAEAAQQCGACEGLCCTQHIFPETFWGMLVAGSRE